MKKILSLLIAILLTVSLCACGGGGEDDVSTDAGEQSTESTSEVVQKAPYDGIFQVGFGRVDITPTVPVPLNTGDMMTNVMDPLYVTAIAVHDGKNTGLIITADIKNMGETDYLTLTKQIRQATKVPEENIMFSATHNHSATTPHRSSTDKNLSKWSAQLFTKTVDACKDAIADLSDAEIYIGSFKTTGMAHVRRYILEDGSFNDFRTIGDKKVVGYESEADDTAQIIRFVRADKKDILLTNWQCHVASMIGIYGDSITSDLVYFLRRSVEKDDDLLVAYYQGASGNINWVAKVAGTGKYSSYPQMCSAFGDAALKAADLKKMTKVDAGTVFSKRVIYTADSMKYPEERVNEALIVREGGDTPMLLAEYGFSHVDEVTAVVNSKDRAEKSKFYLSAMRFGDVAFVAVPYEMYDSNGMYVKENSPADMTFVLTCAGGAYAYVASTFASKNGGYDAYKTSFAYGTGDAVAEHLVEMLKKLK